MFFIETKKGCRTWQRKPKQQLQRQHLKQQFITRIT
nr:MAG TPA: hypothetical protein [Caudoviricetes sp.]